MTNKYIITNCPVCYDDIKMCGATLKIDPYTKESTWTNCQDITDCLLKQIVKTCKEVIDNNFMCLGMSVMALDVLRLLEIQECKDE